MDRLDHDRTRESCARLRSRALCWLLALSSGACATREAPAREWSVLRLRDGRSLMVSDVERTEQSVRARDGHDRRVHFDARDTLRVDAMPRPTGREVVTENSRANWHWAARGAVAVPVVTLSGVGFATGAFAGLAPALLLNVLAMPTATSAAMWAIGRETGGRGSYGATLLGTYAGLAAQAAIVFAVLYSNPLFNSGGANALWTSYLLTLPLPHLGGWIAFEIDGAVSSTRQRP